jgi:transcription-repair coupling factor (superfamily II helicase)
MNLSGLTALLSACGAYQEALALLRERAAGIPRWGAPRSARPFVLGALASAWGAPVIFLTARIDRAYNVAEQLPLWLNDSDAVYRFGEPAPFFYERAPWGDSASRTRIEALAALLDERKQEHPVIVASARALMQRTLPVSQFRGGMMVLRRGERHRIEGLIERWIGLGYQPASMVIEAGTFSRRGGILDIFPTAAAEPTRIEFFDDEIESLRAFDPATQRSTRQIDQVVITPAREALPVQMPPLAAQLADWFAQLPSSDAEPLSPRTDAAALASGTAFPYLEYYLPYLSARPVGLLDYAPSDALIVIDDLDELRAAAADIEARAEQARAELEAKKLLPLDMPPPYLRWAELEGALQSRHVVSLGTLSADEEAPLRRLLAPEARFGGQLKTFLSHVRRLRDQGDRVVIMSTQTARLGDLWRETETSPPPLTDRIDTPPPAHSIRLIDGTIQEGWILHHPEGAVHVFTDAEIFGWSRPEPRRRRAARRLRMPEIAYSDLRPGDYVVHVDYGIGKFGGMRRRTLEGIEREYLLIEYAGTDTLFVPIHQTDRLTRYIGADDTPPTLNRLGQQDWLRLRGRVKKAVEEEARDLLSLYAARASAPGYAFGADTPWQHEMEASFPFIETEDQLRAIREVKRDMEQPHPMDRLICGDVGYGKTEVALRAAFKAVIDGKQVALLVPTTILAQQHYETFRRRLAAFPIKIELLSRFRTAQEQKAALAKLASGELDIIIGTHRLLSDDVRFKDLGLVIIDEEQRFGVKHKEHLKRLRTSVDVLTMTATPIPRTLFMSLTGVRDISMIQTPPEDRLPVLTHVGVFDENLVRQAVLRELERGGQVFVVHNRINTIDIIRERLEQIVPEARIVIAHGQMEGRLLESIMTAFSSGEYDLLLSTSIIESGLDIPNANTLIVDRADLFGLSQLYQLRGRVGRGAQQGYAYFFHPPTSRLTDEARTRLETLSEYTALGAGYQIAMRDLEMRGAGDILSTRQTGHVAAVGFHLYTQMLASAVQKLKAERGCPAAERPISVSESSIIIDLPLAAYLPPDYIPDIEQRISIYRRIGGLTTIDEVEAVRGELIDRFGALPPAVDGLLYQIQVKIMALKAGATAVVADRDHFDIRLPYLPTINRDLLELRLGEGIRVTRTAVEVSATAESWRGRLMYALEKLTKMAEENAALILRQAGD